MNELKNQERGNYWIRREIEIGEGQSDYAKKLKEIWIGGSDAFLDMKFRNKEALKYAKKYFKEAVLYEVTEIAFVLALRLSKFYAYRGSRNEMLEIQKQVKKYQSLINIETNVDFFLTDVDKDIVHRLSNKKVLDKIDNYIEEVNKYLLEFDSLNLILGAYSLMIRQAQLRNNKNEIISLSNQAMEIIEKKDFDPPHVAYLIFEFPKILINIENKNFDAAMNIITGLYEKISIRSVNWNTIHSSEVLLNFRTLNFEKVKQLLSKVNRKNDTIFRERNKIYGAYASLFTSHHFPLGKFTGELLEHSKDREGHRANIIIVHLLHLLKYRRYGKYIDKVEAVKKFVQLYLKSNDIKFIRVRSFIKCLILAAHPRVGFNSAAWLRRTNVHLQKIQSNPRIETNQLLEQEIIDFEYLYSHVSSILK